jgi:serine/threonine protein kinase
MNTDSLLGKQLDEYQIDQPLGSGGMARVYRALDTRLQRYVALKVIAPDFRTLSDYQMRFGREAQSIARLEHPSIVRVYRVGEASGLYYIAMEYIEGADLDWLIHDYKKDGEVMPLASVSRVLAEVGAALDYAHSKQVIHRDVKPGNIILDKTGRAILTDFGLALLVDIGTRGEILGSPHYIAPEQAISSGNVVPQSDLYSLGVTLFEMLTGELPFSGGDAMEIAMRHVSEPPPPPSRFNEAIPASVDDVILRSLEKEPSDRYKTCAELSAAFQNAIVDWPTSDLLSYKEAHRPSSVTVPQKVSEQLTTEPLPSLQPLPLNQALGIPTQASLPVSSPASMRKASAANATKSGVTQPTSQRSSGKWRSPLVFAIGVFVVGTIGVILGILALFGDAAQTVNMRPASTSAIRVTAATEVSSLGRPASIESPTASSTATALPTVAPTFTAVVLATATATLQPPTAKPVATIPIQASPLPENRSVPPPGSRRLGEFTVEGYCNNQGFGVILVNNQSDWACTGADGSIRLILGPADFDNICRVQYNSPSAFAIRDQQRAIQAYNWSCYDYPAQPDAPPTIALLPTAVVAVTSTALATPSVTTLALRTDKDWVALVNVSGIPLSLQGVEFRHKDQSIKAAAWGKDTLLPGECLRISKTDKAPKGAPPGCAHVSDYPGGKDERKRWFEDCIIITINPSITYYYPSAKCKE